MYARPALRTSASARSRAAKGVCFCAVSVLFLCCFCAVSVLFLCCFCAVYGSKSDEFESDMLSKTVETKVL